MNHLMQHPKSATWHGFTLIEFIVVIVIIGVLAIIAIPQFTGVTATAEHAALQALAANLNSAATADFAIQKSTSGAIKTDCNDLKNLISPPLDETVYTLSGTAPFCTLTRISNADVVNFRMVTN